MLFDTSSWSNAQKVHFLAVLVVERRLAGVMARETRALHADGTGTPSELAPVANFSGKDLGDLAKADGVNGVVSIHDDADCIEGDDVLDLVALERFESRGVGKHANLGVRIIPRGHADLRDLVRDALFRGFRSA